MAMESGGSIKPVAIVIVGADALLAARPATAIQLWHACVASGYDLAVPATWGDELIAAECLRAVGAQPEPVSIMCSCPMVARAIAEGDPELADHLVSLVAPPVATARYLRRVYGDRKVHITYAGACPAAGDSAIDAWITPPEMLDRFATTGIDLATQPQLFESVLPPDRRRHTSQPGGIPTAERAAALPRPRRLIEVTDDDVMAAIRSYLASGVPTLVDVAPRLGCACSGVTADVDASEARLAVTLLEPPRSSRPVMAEPGGLALLRRAAPRPVSQRPAARGADNRAVMHGDAATGGESRERIVATPRPASRSPLSWNLRERALPQPPTSGGMAERESTQGASSARWTRRSEARPGESRPAVETRTEGGARTGSPIASGGEAPDAVTAAAIRALESAGQGKTRVVTGASDTSAVRESAATPPAAGPASTLAATEASSESRATPVSEASRPAEDASAPTAGRPTPPGGYWFIPERASPGLDAEVVRASAGTRDGEPDDVVRRAEIAAMPVGDEIPVEPEADDVGAEPVAAEAETVVEERTEAASPGTVTPSSPVADVEPEAPKRSDSEDVVAELEAMFSSVGASPDAEHAAQGSAHEAAGAVASETTGSATGTDPEIEVVVGVTDAAASVDSETPHPSRIEVQRDGAPPDRPWMVIMTIIVVLAGSMVARNIARRSGDDRSLAVQPLLERVESTSAGSLPVPVEAGGASPLSTSAAPPDPVGRAVTSQPGARTSTRSPTSRPREARHTVPVSSVTRDSLARDTVAATRPMPPVTDTVAATVPVPSAVPSPPSPDSARAARDAEIAAIRAEITRRAARLDSIARAVGTMNAPARSPSGSPPPASPPRPVPPPASRPPGSPTLPTG